MFISHKTAFFTVTAVKTSNLTYLGLICVMERLKDRFLSSIHVRYWRRSGGEAPEFNSGGPGSSLGQVMWDLWWTERHWGLFPPSCLVFPATQPFH
jgi:hypothetical protein